MPELLAAAAQLLAEHGYWKDSDKELMAAWLKDLEALGYRFPRRHTRHSPPAFSLQVPDQASSPAAAPAATPAEAGTVAGPAAAPAPSAAPGRRRTPVSWVRHDSVALVVFFNGRYGCWLGAPTPFL